MKIYSVHKNEGERFAANIVQGKEMKITSPNNKSMTYAAGFKPKEERKATFSPKGDLRVSLSPHRSKGKQNNNEIYHALTQNTPFFNKG